MLQTGQDSYIPRTLEHPFIQAAGLFPVMLVTGPRQVGKTTLLRHLCGQDRRYVTLDDPTLRDLARRDPALFLERYGSPVLIDEIQYAPELLPYLKMRVDQVPGGGQFWLTGSQQFHLMKGVSESLAGRVGIVNLLGFSVRERRRKRLDVPPFLPTAEAMDPRQGGGAARSVAEVFHDIWLGGFPALQAASGSARELFYSSYLQTYLQRDVRDLARVGDELTFLRFVKACAARTAQLLNLSDLARDADVSVHTAKHWLSILEASFVVFLLPPYHSNVTKRLVKTPKLFFLDTGLCAYLTDWSSPQTLEAGAMAGAIVETHVLCEVLKSYWHVAQAPHLYFFRDKDGTEVDLLLERDGTLFPIEVKKAMTPRTEWLAPLGKLARSLPSVGPGAVVFLGSERLPLSREVTLLPVDWL